MGENREIFHESRREVLLNQKGKKPGKVLKKGESRNRTTRQPPPESHNTKDQSRKERMILMCGDITASGGVEHLREREYWVRPREFLLSQSGQTGHPQEYSEWGGESIRLGAL